MRRFIGVLILFVIFLNWSVFIFKSPRFLGPSGRESISPTRDCATGFQDEEGEYIFASPGDVGSRPHMCKSPTGGAGAGAAGRKGPLPAVIINASAPAAVGGLQAGWSRPSSRESPRSGTASPVLEHRDQPPAPMAARESAVLSQTLAAYAGMDRRPSRRISAGSSALSGAARSPTPDGGSSIGGTGVGVAPPLGMGAHAPAPVPGRRTRPRSYAGVIASSAAISASGSSSGVNSAKVTDSGGASSFVAAAHNGGGTAAGAQARRRPLSATATASARGPPLSSFPTADIDDNASSVAVTMAAAVVASEGRPVTAQQQSLGSGDGPRGSRKLEATQLSEGLSSRGAVTLAHPESAKLASSAVTNGGTVDGFINTGLRPRPPSATRLRRV